MCCPFEVENGIPAEIRREYLYQHLESGGMSWLRHDPEKGMAAWRTIAGQEMVVRCDLLKAMDHRCRELTGKTPSDRMKKAGPTLLFSHTVQEMVVDMTSVDLEYGLAPAGAGGLYNVSYGPLTIALADSREDGKRYIKWHQELAGQAEESDQLLEIADLREQRNMVDREIEEALTRIVVGGHVPGTCDGCPA